MHTLILTCAGESSRFPTYGPKWTLTHPSGEIMAAEAIRHITGYDALVVAIRLSHADKYPPELVRQAMMGTARCDSTAVHVVVVPDTEGPLDTVEATLKSSDLPTGFFGGAITIKDCDNSFAYELPDMALFRRMSVGSVVAVGDLSSSQIGRVATANKGYVRLHGTGHIEAVANRGVISSWFSAGAYTFASVDYFRLLAKHLPSVATMLDVIRQAVHGTPDRRAYSALVAQYQDWGTREDWEAFCAQYSTLFVDIDGTLLSAGHQRFHPQWDESTPLEQNWRWLNQQYEAGKTHIVLTTSRPEHYRDRTVKKLAGLKYHRLIMGLPNAQRILINDYVPGRPATARTILLPRNSDNLEQHART